VSHDDELRSLKPAAPPPRADFVDGVMRQLAARPLPRRSRWRRLFAEREVTVRFRPATLLLGACAAVAVLALARPRPAPPAPVVTAGRTITPPPSSDGAPVLIRFALAAPRARAVGLAGDFNGWRADRAPLVRGANGVWTVEVPLGRGNWSYSFVVDGQWVEDPLADNWRADGFGGRNAVVRIGDVPVGAPRGG
jgi:hypothetical protein